MIVRVLTLLIILAGTFADKSVLFAEEPHTVPTGNVGEVVEKGERRHHPGS